MDVDTRLLRYFTAVAEEGNLTRAAERLYVSQPALTKQIRQLERELGLTLFTRSRSGMALTGAGRELARNAPAVLSSWSHTLRAVRAAESRATRLLRVGFVASAANELTQPAIAEFVRRRPGWQVRLTQPPWDDPTGGLADGQADAALLRAPFPGQDDMEFETLITEDRWVALPASHRLAGREVIPFAELLDEPFVATPAASGRWRDYWLATDERGGREAIIGAVAHNPDEWLNAIAGGLGVSLTPAATARFYQRPDVAYRPVDGVSPSRVVVARPRTTAGGAGADNPAADFVRACVAGRDAAAARAPDGTVAATAPDGP